ncbi:NAD(P)H-binding protein [Streptacidiphilus jiangxiensis]|uniref:Uncharacterized conserved protein YbjT, contains NAD(P)-binding and DUF2867 domains n=1 Tax=Streptacidiphilus jiangxiensis TaxID=235985 RepID=A0A1H7JNB2_STRJI|nr:NAD(P)H-binding protein [Streptacidiphilus jiangxiensis]SEK76081.1 Uncharacterized conserved protein YbjT, contains NAD(P)-binding and DUF2867 domains [Streptacidiphilus jiangxiensis]
MIVVTGARGQVGSQVYAQLEALGADTLPVARSEGRTPSGRPYYVGDLDAPDSLAGALDLAEAVFLYPNFDHRFAELLAGSGVRRVVLLSSSWVEVKPGSLIGAKHRAAEDLLRETGLPFTLLRPDTFMTNDHFWLSEIAHGTLGTAFPDALTAPIACADIAAVAVAALRDGTFENESLLLTGDEELSQRFRLEAVAARLGVPVTLDVLDEDEMLRRYARYMPEPVAEDMIDGMRKSLAAPLARAGGFARATGRPALRYRDWLISEESRFVPRGVTAGV